MRALVLLVLILSPLADRLEAQRLTPSRFASGDATVTARPARTPTPWLAAGGLVGGAAGLFGGALIGGKLTEDDCEDCSIVGVIYGGIAGGSSLLPLGVHLANGRRGNYGKSLLASLVIGAAGFGISYATDEYGLMFAVPVAQLISSIAIERGTTVTEPKP
jgi:hypothetical protein